MKSWIHFFREHTNLILFGFVLTFSSSFGQTFLVALFVPEVLEEFGLSNASFSGIYGAATLASALCLTWLGRYIDRIDLRSFACLVVGGMCLSLLLFSQANQLFLLAIGLWGMRLSGQGLMSHTAVTTMARYFEEARGKAISIATLGYPAGNALLPLIMAFSIAEWGWRKSLLLSAALLAVLLPPAIFRLLRKVNTNPKAFLEASAVKDKTQAELQQEKVGYRQIVRTKAFWLIAPPTLAIPMLITAFFFYQLPLGEAKGWPAEWVAASFTAYAVSSALCMILAGQLIDKLSATRLFPFFLFPLLLAMLLIIFSDSRWITPIYMVLMGASSGFGNTIKSAVQAEVFGVQHLGTVRSLFSALMVVSTAIGPPAFGLLLDAGFSFESTIGIAAIYLLLNILWSFRIIHRRRVLRWYSFLRG